MGLRDGEPRLDCLDELHHDGQGEGVHQRRQEASGETGKWTSSFLGLGYVNFEYQ